MAGRQSTVLKSKKEKPRPSERRKPRRGLDALAIAENENPSKLGLSRHRFGADEDDGSKRKRGPQDDDIASKRRRTEDDEESDSEDEVGGEDSDGNEWQTGKVDSEDDSDIDSDDALGSSDEEKFEGFAFRGSSQSKKKAGGKKKKSRSVQAAEEVDSEEFDGLSEEEPEEDLDDDLGEDAVDLATAWDMNAEESEEEAPKKKTPKNQTNDDSDDSMGESEDDEESVDDGSDLSISEDEGDSKDRGLSKLQKFVNTLEPDQSEPNKSGHEFHSVLPSGDPSEYGLTQARKLTVADLIPTITDSRLKGSLKHIDSTNSSSTKAKSGKLDAPLAKRQQDRIDRSAAYQKSKETLDRWIDTVKTNRRAEHLSFPLPEPNAPQEARIVDSKPRTDLESTVQNILVESGLAESNGRSAEDRIQEFEELQVNKLPLDEIQARRAELRKSREVMFREEMRSKRIKKIKSKAYRRVHRKEREREEVKDREALAAAGVDLDEEDRELNDRRRAEARMGAKHKDSKWAKSLQQTGRTAWDEDARSEMAELARREEELQKRMEGKKVRADEEYLSESREDSDDEGDGSDDGFGSEDEAQRLKRELGQLENKGDEVSAGPHANLFSMKFMQNAEAARKATNDAEIKQLNRDLGDGESQSEKEDAETGRKRFGAQKTESTKQTQPPPIPQREFEEPESDDEGQKIPEPAENVKFRADKKAAQKPSRSTKLRPLNDAREEVDEPADVDENPWLSEQVKGPRKKKGAESGLTDITLISSTAGRGSSGKKESVRPEAAHKRQNKLADSDGDADKDEADDARGPVVLQNQDLVKKAFAGDDVLEDFSKEKLDTVEDEGDKVVDETLPGWGSWTGTGLSKRDKKQVKRNLTTVEGVKPEKRKDAKLDRVIINEKRVKKNTKYLATQLPHPFESRQQYERSLRLPVGPEWTTKETFQNATKPRVMVKQGVIKPMQRPAL